MIVFYYDKTFEGLLCAVFDAFKLKKTPEILLTEGDMPPLLATECHHVDIRNSKYERVQIALKKRVTKVTLNQMVAVWLSELPDSDLLIFRYVCKIFKSSDSIETDFADPDVLTMKQIAHKVDKEREHLLQFVRFNAIENQSDSTTKYKQNEKVYFAVVAPIYNALPLVIDFFKDRFADQKWVIYDKTRQYGYFYDLNQTEQITLNEQDDLIVNGNINQNYLTSDEMLFQTMWFRYCKALTIKERLNPKLQRQFMPKRFWSHLPEMKNH